MEKIISLADGALQFDFISLISCWLALLFLSFPRVALEDPKTEDLSQEVRGFIFSKILVCSIQTAA